MRTTPHLDSILGNHLPVRFGQTFLIVDIPPESLAEHWIDEINP